MGVINRINRDYFQKSRAKEYEHLISAAVNQGYEVLSVIDYWYLIQSKSLKDGCNYLVLRHDVDVNNVSGNTFFFEIEKKYGVKATYYFRLFSMKAHLPLISDLKQAGFEVGYHYEELATLSKKNGWGASKCVEKNRAIIEKAFCENLSFFKQETGLTVYSICAHGDWMNRHLGIPNQTQFSKEFLNEQNILLEAYDSSYMSAFDVYISDVALHPRKWARNYSVMDAIKDGKSRIYFLSHEGLWFPNFLAVTESNLVILREKILWRCRQIFKWRPAEMKNA